MKTISVLDRAKNAISAFRGRGYVHSSDDYTKEIDAQNKLAEEKKKKAASDFPQVRQIFRTHEDIRTLENAIADRESFNYNRERIHAIFRQFVVDDLHVSSQWNNRKNKTKKKSFGIHLNGDSLKDDEMTKLFEKEWVYDCMDAILDSRVFGFTLAELYNWDKELMKFTPWRNFKGMIADPVQIVHRDFVKPETGYIVEQPGMLKGVDFFDPKFRNQLIYVGNKSDGIYWKLAKPILFKNNAVENWSEWIEVFGLDAILVNSSTRGADRKKLVDSLKEFTTARIAIMDEDEKFSTVGANKTDAYKVFHEMGRYVDEGVSKAIFGQDVISNNTGQVVGEIGENVAHDYADSDQKLVTAVMNEQVLPLVARRSGLEALNNAEFKFESKMSLRELKNAAEIDLMISQMGLRFNPDYINDKYGVEVETNQVATLQSVVNRLNKMMPSYAN